MNKNISILSLITFLLFISFSFAQEKNDLKIIDTMLKDSSSYFYVDAESYKNKNAELPIGIFDSGTGGLTVFDAIVNFDMYNNETREFNSNGDSKNDFNKERFIYLADQANMPYGNYGSENKTLLLKEHILKDAQFLLSDKYYQSPRDGNFIKDKSPIKALVIACNTATAFGKDDFAEFVKKANLNIKVIGVIGAGVRAALENIPLEKDISIAVMATAGTVSSNGYVNEIETQLKQRNNEGKVSVFQQAGIGLAGAVDGVSDFIDSKAKSPRENYKGPSDLNENLQIDKSILARYHFDWTNNKMLYDGTTKNPSNIQINSVDNYIAYHLTTLLEKIIADENAPKLSKIILGCTHYPFYTKIFKEKLEGLRNYKENSSYVYKDHLAENVEFIDPSVFTAKELYDYLNEENLFTENDINKSEFYISVPNLTNRNTLLDENGNFTYNYKYGRTENNIQEYVKRVPFSKTNIPNEVIERLAETIPNTYTLIKKFNENNSKTAYLKDDEKIK